MFLKIKGYQLVYDNHHILSILLRHQVKAGNSDRTKFEMSLFTAAIKQILDAHPHHQPQPPVPLLHSSALKTQLRTQLPFPPSLKPYSAMCIPQDLACLWKKVLLAGCPSEAHLLPAPHHLTGLVKRPISGPHPRPTE